MKVFEVTTPDSRKVRHEAQSASDAASRLAAGYTVTGEVLGADAKLEGGYVVPFGDRSLLAELLDRHTDDMLKWMAKHGFTRFDP